jgi:hypothetical protein
MRLGLTLEDRHAARPYRRSLLRTKMLQTQNPLDVDIMALKKGEIDLGTSMYASLCFLADSQHGNQVQRRSDIGSRQSNNHRYHL